MHWPQAANIERVDSRDAIVVLRDGAALEPDDFSQQSLGDLLRASLTFGVSALDRYVHERVTKRFVAALRERKLTKQQEDFQIPATLALKALERLRESAKAGRDVRPANEIRVAVQEILHQRPFQSWREIEFAFQLIGINGLAGSLQAALGLGDFTPTKDQLNEIARRRNLIVHEGDIPRHKRGGKPTAQSIEPQYVRTSLDFLNRFATALDTV